MYTPCPTVGEVGEHSSGTSPWLWAAMGHGFRQKDREVKEVGQSYDTSMIDS